MPFIYKLYNIYRDIEEFMRRYAYLIFPLLFIAIYIFLKKTLNISIDEEFNSNIINVSGTLSGFLFTSLGIMLSLPENRFTQVLKESGYIEIIHKSMFLGIVFLIITLVFGLFNVLPRFKIIFFIVGLSETLLSSYYLYRVTKLSSKSK